MADFDLCNASYKKAGIEGIFDALSKFSVASIVDFSMASLGASKVRGFEDLSTSPWITLLLVELAFRNRGGSLYLGDSLSGSVFDDMRKDLWNLVNDGVLDGPNMRASLRAFVPVQVEFQVARPAAAVRWPALVNRLDRTHPARVMFLDAIGLEPCEYIDAIQFLLGYSQLNARIISKEFIDRVPSVFRGALLKVMDFLAKDFLGLASEFRRDSLPEIWELRQFPFAAKYPFFILGNDDIFIWHPAMLDRALENLPHQLLKRFGEDYTKNYSLLFEDYVTELSQDMDPKAITEAMWWKQMGSQVKAVEAILPLKDVNVFVEAKMSLYHDAVLLDRDPSRLQSRLERVIEGVFQARKVSQRIRGEPKKYPYRARAAEEFQIIVVSRELYIGDGSRLEMMLPNRTLYFDDESVNARLPLSHVFVVSIDDFELLNSIVLSSKGDLLCLLREIVVRNKRPPDDSIFFADHLRAIVKEDMEFSFLIRDCRNNSHTRLRSIFPGRRIDSISKKGLR